MKKPSFLDRITGNSDRDDYDDDFDTERETSRDELQPLAVDHFDGGSAHWGSDQPEDENFPAEGELPVDMYQTEDEIVIRALVAGVSPGDLDIAITRDRVVIKGVREEYREASDDDYYHSELFWGIFSRNLVLPEEVMIDEATANEKYGFLEIRLPKVDKHRSAKLKVKSANAPVIKK